MRKRISPPLPNRLTVTKKYGIYIFIALGLIVSLAMFRFHSTFNTKPAASSKYNYDLGLVYYNSNKPDSAIIQFRQLITANPTFDSAYYFLGRSFLEIDNTDSAEFYFNKTQVVNPNFEGLYNHLGAYYSQKKDWNNSIGAYLKTVGKGSLNIEANLALGRLYGDDGNLEAALKTLNRILKVEPQNIDALIKITIVQKRLKLYETSLKTSKKIIEIAPSNSEGYLNMGNAYHYLKEYTKRNECYIKGARLGNNYCIGALKKYSIKWN